MATNPYSSQSSSGYNSSPPSDDGSETEANRIKWSTIRTKLSDVLKTFAEAIDAAVLAAFAKTINTDADEANQMAGSLAFADSELTVATGAVTAKRTYHTVDTEADAASDDLDTIATGSVSDGAILILSANNASRTVVCKHEATAGAGDMHLAQGRDFSLDDANKRIVLHRDGADWYEISRTQESGVIQRKQTELTTLDTIATVLPFDDTIPQNTEGDEVFTLAITPAATTNKLRLEFSCQAGSTVDGAGISAALFQDTTAGALAAAGVVSDSISSMQTLHFTHEMDAGTVSETTFKIRAGPSSGSMYINGQSGARKLGGVLKATLTITELAP